MPFFWVFLPTCKIFPIFHNANYLGGGALIEPDESPCQNVLIYLCYITIIVLGPEIMVRETVNITSS